MTSQAAYPRDATCGPEWSETPVKPPGGDGLLAAAASSPADAWVGGAFMQHWDGSTWSVTPSVDVGYHLVYGLTSVDDGDAWAVGEKFWFVNRTSALILHWDGTSWRQPRSPGRLGSSGLVGVDASTGDDVWAVGYSRGGTLSEHWDGATWSVVPTPRKGVAGSVLSSVSTLASDDAWAVGSWFLRPSVPRPLIIHWDGNTWQRVRPPAAIGRLTSVAAIASDDVWAVGDLGNQNRIIHWDGIAWSVVPTPDPGSFDELDSVAGLGPDQAWAVGSFFVRHTAGGPEGRRALMLEWDGRAWKQVVPIRHLGAAGLGSVAAAPGYVLAVGAARHGPLALTSCPG